MDMFFFDMANNLLRCMLGKFVKKMEQAHRINLLSTDDDDLESLFETKLSDSYRRVCQRSDV